MQYFKDTSPPPAVRRALLRIGERDVEVVVRYTPLARRMSVKVHPASGEVSVVAPRRRSFDAAIAFAQSESAWIAGQLDRIPARIRLAPGLSIPLRGEPVVIAHTDERHVTAVCNEEPRLIRVGGRIEHAPRRIADFLKKQARDDIERLAQAYAGRLGVRIRRISLRDPIGRWGSCSASRSLSFSWRLIMAPPAVLEYVVAHEVAHLAQMNHSPKFWTIVRTLYGDPKPPQAWLAVHGAALHRYRDD